VTKFNFMFVSINENWLSEYDFEKYKNFSNYTKLWGERTHSNVWSGRVIYNNQFENLQEENFNLLYSINKKISLDYNLSEDIYPDYLGLVKWEIGDAQHPHADGEEINGKHIFYWRNFGCVYYLNDDYEGGEIYFPNQNIQIKPKPNTLVFFPGTLEFLHGVKPITKGIRYTLTSFWTFDKTHSLKL